MPGIPAIPPRPEKSGAAADASRVFACGSVVGVGAVAEAGAAGGAAAVEVALELFPTFRTTFTTTPSLTLKSSSDLSPSSTCPLKRSVCLSAAIPEAASIFSYKAVKSSVINFGARKTNISILFDVWLKNTSDNSHFPTSFQSLLPSLSKTPSTIDHVPHDT